VQLLSCSQHGDAEKYILAPLPCTSMETDCLWALASLSSDAALFTGTRSHGSETSRKEVRYNDWCTCTRAACSQVHFPYALVYHPNELVESRRFKKILRAMPQVFAVRIINARGLSGQDIGG
jgi:hypothetical protein